MNSAFDKQAITAGLSVLALIIQFFLLKLAIRLTIRSTLITVLLLFIISQIPTWVASRSLMRFMTVSSSEMTPALNPGDCVLLLLNQANHYRPTRNDIIAFPTHNPGMQREVVQISRVVGLPGDRLSHRDGLILINDRIAGISSSAIKGSTGKAYIIPEGLCYHLGDNPALSIDSRQLGLLPLDQVSGHVERIVFPAFPRLFKLDQLLQKPAAPPERPEKNVRATFALK